MRREALPECLRSSTAEDVSGSRDSGVYSAAKRGGSVTKLRCPRSESGKATWPFADPIILKTAISPGPKDSQTPNHSVGLGVHRDTHCGQRCWNRNILLKPSLLGHEFERQREQGACTWEALEGE